MKLTTFAATALAATAIGATAFTAPAASAKPLPVDPGALGQAIASSIKAANNREAAIEAAVNQAYFDEREEFGVLAMNLQQPHDDSKLDVAGYTSFDYDGITYGLYLIEGGQFTNNGDGGFANWRYRGLVDRRDGMTVYFKDVG
ncbi:hypothetical protein [Nocardia mexicana]|uniref:Stress response protein YvgO n=1 Tax=Nocardia mexicana TaxID=279262 RepID=A0A370GT17_9NOCA|nr:hypothetical protein [Nocardia mexicana]RDI46470.1 hypothetical protein DFR68_111229 [Nocardia mexicana]